MIQSEQVNKWTMPLYDGDTENNVEDIMIKVTVTGSCSGSSPGSKQLLRWWQDHENDDNDDGLISGGEFPDKWQYLLWWYPLPKQVWAALDRLYMREKAYLVKLDWVPTNQASGGQGLVRDVQWEVQLHIMSSNYEISKCQSSKTCVFNERGGWCEVKLPCL